MSAQMYKVFYNKSVIYIAKKSTNIGSDVRLVSLANKMETIQFIGDYLKLDDKVDVWLSGYSTDDIFEDVKSCLRFVEAAGGLVKMMRKTICLFYALGYGICPKAK